MSQIVHSLSDVAKAAGLSYRHVRRLVTEGKLKVRELPVHGNQHEPRIRVTDAELRRFLRSRGKR